MTDKTTAVNLTGDEIQTIMRALRGIVFPESAWTKLIRAMDGRSPLTLTDNPPTVPGRYWHRLDRREEWYIGKVTERDFEKQNRWPKWWHCIEGQWGSSDGVTPTPLQEPEG